MAKRWTETTNWVDRWFISLSNREKIAYLWMLDICDAAGVCDASGEILSGILAAGAEDFEERHEYQVIGFGDQLVADLIQKSAGRIVVLPCGKCWLTRFIDYQQGGWDRLSESNNSHLPIWKSIAKHRLEEFRDELRKSLPDLILETPIGDPLRSPSKSKSKSKSKKMTPPETDEVAAYIREKGYIVDAEEFHAFYTSKGWKVGNQAMKSWRSAVVTWEKRRRRDADSSDGAVDRAQAILEAEGLA